MSQRFKTIVRKEMEYKLKEEKPKLKWYQRFWNWILKLFRKQKASLTEGTKT